VPPALSQADRISSMTIGESKSDQGRPTAERLPLSAAPQFLGYLMRLQAAFASK
jgi:hypothetical protein